MSANQRAKVSALPPNSNSDLPVRPSVACSLTGWWSPVYANKIRDFWVKKLWHLHNNNKKWPNWRKNLRLRVWLQLFKRELLHLDYVHVTHFSDKQTTKMHGNIIQTVTSMYGDLIISMIKSSFLTVTNYEQQVFSSKSDWCVWAIWPHIYPFSCNIYTF